MNTSASISYKFHVETVNQANKLPVGTVSEVEHKRGMMGGEPLIVALDAMLQYACAHHTAYKAKLSEDHVLGPEYLATIVGVRGLLNGMGAIANRMNKGTDSKDNGACEGMFWECMNAAGFTEADL